MEGTKMVQSARAIMHVGHCQNYGSSLLLRYDAA